VSDVRTEHDAFGAIAVPKDRYWGAQTQRALEVFQVSDERFPVALIRAFALQKIAAVRANLQLGRSRRRSQRRSKQRHSNFSEAVSTIISRCRSGRPAPAPRPT
jgi:fumarate hydratase class II